MNQRFLLQDMNHPREPVFGVDVVADNLADPLHGWFGQSAPLSSALLAARVGEIVEANHHGRVLRVKVTHRGPRQT